MSRDRREEYDHAPCVRKFADSPIQHHLHHIFHDSRPAHVYKCCKEKEKERKKERKREREREKERKKEKERAREIETVV